MKLKKYIIGVLTVLISLFAIGTEVNAAPNSVTSKSSPDSDWLNLVGGINLSRKKAVDANGKEYLAYCVDISTSYQAEATCQINEWDAEKATQIAAAMSYYGTDVDLDDAKFYTTQLAIWYLTSGCTTTGGSTSCTNEKAATTFSNIKLDFVNPDNSKYGSSTNSYIANVARIINAAKNATVNKTPSISFGSSNISFQKQGDFYVTNPISVTSENVPTYSLSLLNQPNGTLIVDESGNSKTQFNVSEKFIIKVPTSSLDNGNNFNFSVKLTATSNKLYESYKYICNGGNAQNISLIDYTTRNLEKTLNLSLKTNSIEISKVDATNGKELPGATLILTCPDGKEITWVSGDQPHILSGLEPGEYILTEKIAPEGYEISSESIKFTVNADGTVDKKVVMENEPKPKQVPTGDIKIAIIAFLILSSGGAAYYFYLKYRRKHASIDK